MVANRQASTAQPGATPAASGLKVAWSHASIATPANPMTSPSTREWVGRSFSQSHATTAPNSGTVAFNMADRPVVIASSANAKQAKGIAELSRPTTKIARQLRRNTGVSPRSQSRGNRPAGRGHRPEFHRRHSGEQERRTPDRGQQDEIDQPVVHRGDRRGNRS